MKRTKCACKACQEFCKTIPGMLTYEDLIEIQKYLQCSLVRLNSKLRSSQGALLGNPITGETYRIGTIVPAQKPNGTCVWWDEQTGLCEIHPVAPYGCRVFDAHMSKEDGDTKVIFGLQKIQRLSILYNIRRNQLQKIGSTPEERRGLPTPRRNLDDNY